ncbi:MAG: 4Fe-4S dicluster domain-containing protein [Promethearchaeota archaeon]
MEEKIMEKSYLAEFISKALEDHDVYAPSESKGNLVFKKIENARQIVLNYVNTKIPPKEILFPRQEVLFEFKKEGGKLEIFPPKFDDKKKMIFGIRACDAHSFKLLDTFFSFGQFKDDLYLKKRDHMILVGIACNTPAQTCFCTSVGLDPFKKDDFDVFFVDLGEKFLVEAITDRGKELLSMFPSLQDATSSDLEKIKALKEQAENTIAVTIDFSNTPQIMNDNFYDDVWAEISETCIGCGSCSFLCPTCHCFDVIDENDYANHRGRRIRVWDNCQRVDFTLHTSGHNPRTEKKQRCRQRLAHKFCYYPQNYDLLGCVGCGRCVLYCPVNNDTREIIRKINAIAKKRGAEVNVVE